MNTSCNFCEHQKSAVINTNTKSSGKHRVGHIKQYDYLVMRRRKCLDCGYKFTTVEVDRELFDTTMAASYDAKNRVISDIIQYLIKKQMHTHKETSLQQ